MQIGPGRRLHVFGRVVIASTMPGSAYGALLNVAAFGAASFGIAIAGLHGLPLSGSIGMLEISGTRTPRGAP